MSQKPDVDPHMGDAPTDLEVTDLVEGDGSLASQAMALLGWHRDNVRGRERTHHPRRVDAGWAIEDPFHGGLVYPRTDPAVICLVHDGGRRVLLGQRGAGRRLADPADREGAEPGDRHDRLRPHPPALRLLHPRPGR